MAAPTAQVSSALELKLPSTNPTTSYGNDGMAEEHMPTLCRRLVPMFEPHPSVAHLPRTADHCVKGTYFFATFFFGWGASSWSSSSSRNAGRREGRGGDQQRGGVKSSLRAWRNRKAESSV